MKISQHSFALSKKHRGVHLVTEELLKNIPRINEIECGLLHVFIKHTSASLSINENSDPSVLIDMEMASSLLVPESLAYTHTDEGSDDMPAHVKASLFGSSLTIPITNGSLNIGTWQGIYLLEHRNRASARNLVCTIYGI